MDKWTPGTHGGTYGGGSPISLAGAVASIDAILEDGLVDNARAMGDHSVMQLKEMQNNYPASNIGDVRGRGLMVGVEFTDQDGNPDAATASRIASQCVANNLLILICGSYQNVIRFIPPLTITQAELDEGLAIFEAAVKG